MNLDYNKLLDDISKYMKYLVRNEKQSAMNTLSSLCNLTGLFDALTGINISTDIFMNNKKIDIYLAKYYYDSLKKFISFLNSNKEHLCILSRNIELLLDPLSKTYAHNYYYSTLNRSKFYTEKEFKEILFSFFNQYGNNTYKIVKRMFDENRINLGTNKKVKYTGFTVTSPLTKDAYIVSTIQYLGIENMILMAHELGHVIDFYSYSANVGKEKSYINPFLEVLSCYFEIAFMDYLEKNYIEPESVLFLFNDKCISDLNSFGKYSKVINSNENLYLNINGEVCAKNSDDTTEDSMIEEDTMYALGYSIALNLLKKYGDNHKEVIKRLNNFVYLSNMNSLQENIENLGLDYEKYLSCDLIRPYVKEKNQLLIKRSIN